MSIDSVAIYNMRQAGASLQQIADNIGRTKERVRQILTQKYGSTRHGLISTQQLCKQLDLSRSRIVDLYEHGVITPEVKRMSGSYQFYLWPASTTAQVTSYLSTHLLCKVCGHPLPKGKRVYCSLKCYEER